MEVLLQFTGFGLLLLAALHIPIGKSLNWHEDARRLTPVNEDIFHVHAGFIVLVLLGIGIPCALEPGVFTEISRAALWVNTFLCVFWALRLYCQWFVYRRSLWVGKTLETAIHIFFTIVWAFLATLFGYLSALQAGWF